MCTATCAWGRRHRQRRRFCHFYMPSSMLLPFFQHSCTCTTFRSGKSEQKVHVSGATAQQMRLP